MSFTLKPTLLLPVWDRVYAYVSAAVCVCVCISMCSFHCVCWELVYFQLPQSTAAHIPRRWHATPRHGTHFFFFLRVEGWEGSSLELNWIKDYFFLFLFIHCFFSPLLLSTTAAFWQHEETLQGLRVCVCVCVNICVNVCVSDPFWVCVCVFVLIAVGIISTELVIGECHHSKAKQQENNL